MHFFGGGVIGHPKSFSQKSHSIRAGISFHSHSRPLAFSPARGLWPRGSWFGQQAKQRGEKIWGKLTFSNLSSVSSSKQLRNSCCRRTVMSDMSKKKITTRPWMNSREVEHWQQAPPLDSRLKSSGVWDLLFKTKKKNINFWRLFLFLTCRHTETAEKALWKNWLRWCQSPIHLLAPPPLPIFQSWMLWSKRFCKRFFKVEMKTWSILKVFCCYFQ